MELTSAFQESLARALSGVDKQRERVRRWLLQVTEERVWDTRGDVVMGIDEFGVMRSSEESWGGGLEYRIT